MPRPRSELFGMAFETLRRNPGRSVLTLLGLAIGVGAFIAMVSFGEGARRSVVAQFEVLGTNLIKVQTSTPGVNPKMRPPMPLADSDVAMLVREGTTFSHV